jgi:hypothetical protein
LVRLGASAKLTAPWRLKHSSTREVRLIGEAENPSHLYRLLPPACLAPEIVEAILDGRQPKGLKLAELLRNTPLSWEEQRRLWSFCKARYTAALSG